MFARFLADLREAGVPVSLREYLAFLEALDAGLVLVLGGTLLIYLIPNLVTAFTLVTTLATVLFIFVWSLILVVTLKYVLLILRADNNGEGGTLSLVAKAQGALGRRAWWLYLIGIVGVSLFFGILIGLAAAVAKLPPEHK